MILNKNKKHFESFVSKAFWIMQISYRHVLVKPKTMGTTFESG